MKDMSKNIEDFIALVQSIPADESRKILEKYTGLSEEQLDEWMEERKLKVNV